MDLKHYGNIVFFIFLLMSSVVKAEALTQRKAQLSNERVNVWTTIIQPSAAQVLKMHRHDYDRVVVALNDGRLKVTNDKGETHYWDLKKNQAYYLSKDPIDELHMDENVSGHPLEVIVIELKD